MLLSDYIFKITLYSIQLFHVYGKFLICGNHDVNQAVVVAFVEVHDEKTGCEMLNLKGLQQIAILQKTLTEIKEREALNNEMSLSLLTMDTCALTENNLSEAFKSFLTIQQTCSDPPFLVGFIGPEKKFKTVHKLTSVFQKYYMLPFATDNSKQFSDMMLSIGNSRVEIRGKIILATLNQLRWKNILVVVSEDIEKNDVMNNMFTDIHLVCVSGFVQLPSESINIDKFYSKLLRDFRESNADGILIISREPNQVRPLLQEMNSRADQQNNPSIILYLIDVGIKSWELPSNFTLILLQETSDTKRGFNLNFFHNKTLWEEYSTQNEVDYKKDTFTDVCDATVAPFEYALHVFWNAAKYAKRIKCELGVKEKSTGICDEMFRGNPYDWKTFLFKSSYYHAETLRKISLGMNVPIVVRVYIMSRTITFPQLIGRITDIGITDMKINLQLFAPPKTTVTVRRCLTPAPTRKISSSISINHESNWLALFSKKMKNLISLNGLISPELNEHINTFIMWAIGFCLFLLGLILLTKFVFRVFKIQTEEERDENRRRKLGRTTRIVST